MSKTEVTVRNRKIAEIAHAGRVAGKSLPQIQSELFNMGYKSKAGGSLHISSISQTLLRFYPESRTKSPYRKSKKSVTVRVIPRVAVVNHAVQAVRKGDTAIAKLNAVRSILHSNIAEKMSLIELIVDAV